MIKTMLKRVKKLSLPARASLAYTIANIVSKGISIITVPIYTRLLTTAEMGVGTTYSSWYTIIYSIVTLSLTSGSLNIAMMEYEEEREKYESCCLSISSITGILFLGIYVIGASYFNNITTLSTPIMLLLGISLVFNPALDLWYTKQRYEYQYISSVIVSISVTILSAICAVIAIISLKDKNVDLGEVKVVSQGTIQILFAVYFYVYIYTKGKTIFNKSMWHNALSWSLPLIVHSLLKSILDLSDRLMIASLCGKSEAGIYGTVYSLAMLSLIVWNAINISLIPVSFEKLEQKDYGSLNRIIQSILVIFGGVAILVTLFAPEILLVFTTEEYMAAVYLVPALSAGIYFTALYNIYGNFLLYKKKTRLIMTGTTIAALSNVVLNYIFIKMNGYVAAAYTTLVSFVILAILQGMMTKKEFGYEIINTKKASLISGIVCVLCNICNLIYEKWILRYILIAIIFLTAWLFRKKIKKMMLDSFKYKG